MRASASGDDPSDACAQDAAKALKPAAVPSEAEPLAPAEDAPVEVEVSLASEAPPPMSSWRPEASLPVLAHYGRFELLGRIARGGMAEILLARERTAADAKRFVVVKRILPVAQDDQEYVRMFLDEGRLMMGMHHPHICHVYDVGQHGGTWYIAMEWVRGASLTSVIRRARARRDRIPAPLAARIVADVAEALHHAHQAKDEHGQPLGIVHRDVSPHNLMVGYDGGVKLLDFGIAKVNSSADHTTTGIVKGKFAYMAPEQCLGKRLDARADVFALGICLYEALTGCALYRRGNDYETLDAVIKEPVPSIRDVDPELPEQLDAIVQRALQKRRADRFPSAQAMQEALERYLTEAGHVVSSARIERMMRGLFEEELQQGPRLEPMRILPTDVPPDEAPEGGNAEGVNATLPPEGGSAGVLVPSRPRRRWLWPAGLAVAATALIALLAFGAGRVPWEPPLEVGSAPKDVRGAAAPVEAEADDATSPERSEAQEPPPAAELGTLESDAPDRTESEAATAEAQAEARRARRAREAAEAEEERGTALLSINTRPWSRVYVGRRLLGTTPIGGAQIPAGRVVLRFEDRDGRQHRRILRAQPGQRLERFIDLGAN